MPVELTREEIDLIDRFLSFAAVNDFFFDDCDDKKVRAEYQEDLKTADGLAAKLNLESVSGRID
jgi:hypothetical protein